MQHYPFAPEQLSDASTTWWQLFNVYSMLALIIGGAVLALMVGIIIKYRTRGETTGSNTDMEPGKIPEDRGGLVVPIIITIMLFGVFFGLLSQSMAAEKEFGGFARGADDPAVIEELETLLEEKEDVIVIRVNAFQWGFSFQYPNGLESDRLILPQGKTIIFNVTSLDVFHTFAIPDLKVKVDAIPGKYNIAWVTPNAPGTFRIQCYELCGVGHGDMITKALVVQPSVFEFWLESGGSLPQENNAFEGHG